MPIVSTTVPTLDDFELAAQLYLRHLPPEHFMEAVPHSTQREITVESLALVRARWPQFKLFNELLVQYWQEGRIKQVCPDNMIVVTDQELQSLTSYNLPLEHTPPLMMLEYVSAHSMRKDYDDNLRRYEQELRVPYYLLFHPERKILHLFKHNGQNYDAVKPNERGRLEIPEVELEAALHEEWVRYWYQGEFLSLPGELQDKLDRALAESEMYRKRADEERAARLALEAEVNRLRALLEQTQRPPTP